MLLKVQYLCYTIYRIILDNVRIMNNIKVEWSIYDIFSRYVILELVRKRTFILKCDVPLFPCGTEKV